MNLLIALTETELELNISKVIDICRKFDSTQNDKVVNPFTSQFENDTPNLRIFILSEDSNSASMLERFIGLGYGLVANYSYYGEDKVPSYYTKPIMDATVTLFPTLMFTSTNSLSDYHCERAVGYYTSKKVPLLNLDKSDSKIMLEVNATIVPHNIGEVISQLTGGKNRWNIN